MLAALEQLTHRHPAPLFTCWENHRSDLEAFEELESQHLRRGHECERERERRQPTWTNGKVAATAAIVMFWGILTVIVHLAGPASNTGQKPVVAVSNAAQPR